VRYDEGGVMRYPHHDERAPETELQRYLAEAEAMLSARGLPSDVEPNGHRRVLSEDFEHLRWFELPAACLLG
jgi:hypothetical protein